jgi:tRNA 2-selenouridine synthase
MAKLSEALQKAAGDSQNLRIYCWRGGMRSNSIAWLANLVGQSTLVLEGGYKSYRRWVLNQFGQPWPLKLLGGRTGSGKTDLLLALAELNVAVVDLEGLAHHRGSSFGGLGLPEQPSTEHYENRLAETLDGHRCRQAEEIWLEAESVQVGRCRIPRDLFLQMQAAEVLEIRRSTDERVNQLVAVYGDQGGKALAEATQRISRRLGPQRTHHAIEAIKRQDWHEACRAMLDYYDRCYDHELAQAQERRSVDLAGEDPHSAARRLVSEGLTQPIRSRGQSRNAAP